MNDAFEAGWIAAGEKKTSAGPLGFFESRTPVTPDRFATSTQFADPFWLRLLLRQATPLRSSSTIALPFTSGLGLRSQATNSEPHVCPLTAPTLTTTPSQDGTLKDGGGGQRVWPPPSVHIWVSVGRAGPASRC